MAPRPPLRAILAVLALLGAGSVVAAPESANPQESPGGTCYKYKYPDSAECGSMKGKEECKGSPSKDTEKCKPEKGAECACGDDDIDF